MKLITKIYWLIILILLSTVTCAEQRYALDFLDIGFGAKALGTGGAFTGMCDDATAPYWNSAGLIQLKKSEINLMTGQMGDLGIAYHSLNYAQKLDEQSTLGINALMLVVENIPDTRQLTTDSSGNPILDESKITYLSTTDNAYFLSYCRKLDTYKGDKLSGGASLKIIQQNYITNSAMGYGLDMGVLYRVGENFKCGASIQDLVNSGMQWDTGTTYNVPVNVRVGFTASNSMGENVSYKLLVDAETRYGSGMYFGGELNFFNKVAFRGGSRQLSSPAAAAAAATTAGFGLNFEGLAFDYVMLLNSDFANDSRISLSIRF